MYCGISCIFQSLYLEAPSINTRHLSQDSWTEDAVMVCGISCILQSLYIDVLRRTTRHMSQDNWAENHEYGAVVILITQPQYTGG
jgi:hypothetical protein